MYATKPNRCGTLTVMAEAPERLNPLKPAGFALIVSGWGLVVSAIVLLSQEVARTGFVAAGVAVEVLGLVLVVRAHIAPKPERRVE